ncbi:MAG: lipoyl(octanoyl) transferase LipB [Verrucomicrobiota bacterium JB023]|nr:lipoyl(octanoyl) transferase LipB [Verrucomicrobiota bacterium JB023]
MNLEVKQLGSEVDYEEGLAIQGEILQKRVTGQGEDTLLLLEHAPVYTIGRTRDQSSLANRDHLPHPVFEISRGGQATYHGPGQLVGYPIINLRPFGQDLHRYLRDLEESLILLCQHFDVPAVRREGLTGIWVEDRKLASIGVGVKKWVTWHGFALNVTPEALPPFQAITPCGLDGVRMTSMQSENPKVPAMTEVMRAYPSFLEKALQQDSTGEA